MLSIDSFRNIRAWNGSQPNAFEELCYQLRDPKPAGATAWKVGNPDRGYEWFIRHQDDTEWGWQVKYTFGIDEFLKLATDTLATVTAERPNCVRLTFCIPFDLPDVISKKKNGGRAGYSAVEKFERWCDTRGSRIPGSERIEILLWSGGDLLSRLNDTSNRGRAWFFWDQEVLSLEWCRRRIDSARAAAGPRYSDELNIEMPISAAIDGLAHTPRLQHERQSLRASFNVAVNKLRHALSGDVNAEELLVAIRSCRTELAIYVDGDGMTDPTELSKALHQCTIKVSLIVDDGDDSKVRSEVNTLLNRIFEIEDHLQSAMAQAAREHVLIVTGDAGQGKTHLFVDAAYRLLSEGQPTALIMGNSLSGHDVLSEIARRFGMENHGWTAMLQAMASAAEAYDRPFVLLIDGINESDHARGWRTELTSLLTEARHYAPWIVVALSVRTTYRDSVLSAQAANLPTIEHQGFAGIEQFAAEMFFAHYKLPAPQLPLVGQDMSNPLFLKLYCETVKDGWNPSMIPPGITVSALFDRYLDSINRKVSENLELDESDRLVQECMRYMAGEFTTERRDWIPRPKAKKYITALAPHLQSWPKTLFGELLAEGLLSVDLIYLDDGPDFVEVEAVKLSYQRFADYMIAEQILSATTVAQLTADPGPNNELHSTICDASAGVIEALSVLIPERFGVELLEASTWNLDPIDRQDWHKAFLSSLPARRTDAITDETVQLFERLGALSPSLRALASQTLIELSVHPRHPLDIDYLHRRLHREAMPERDATWGISLYHSMNSGALGRIIRWATNPDHKNHPDYIVGSVATVLMWMLGTPHRPMRDHITKTLAQLLSDRLDVLEDLYNRFSVVDDPYIFERLAVITHGALIASRASDRQSAVRLVKRMATAVSERTEPDLLSRDALNGALEWSVRAGLLDRVEANVLPRPPRTSLVLDAPTESELFAVYEASSNSAPTQRGYSTILGSICGYGDFGIKIIGPDVRHFSRYSIDEPYPSTPHIAQTVTHDRDAMLAAMQQIVAQYGGDQSEEQTPPSGGTDVRPPRAEFPADAAKEWVFRRVLELGWTSELFAAFDANVSSRGRESHKPERFGKKYQWIALRELLARIIDNYHPRRRQDGDDDVYRGPWQIHGRDIDPTLPPARLLSSTYRLTQFDTTFPADNTLPWWLPDGPDYRRTDPPPDSDWATRSEGIVDIRSQLTRTAPDNSEWVVLHSTHTWKEHDPLEGEDPHRSRRNQWSHLDSWIVPKPGTSSVYKYLSENSLMNKWMPEGRSPTSVAYLGEMPWGAAANDYPQEWETGDRDTLPRNVYPTWNEYCWESVILDCSIDDAVHAWMPSLEIYNAGQLAWLPHTQRWLDTDGRIAAQYCETSNDHHAALLVRCDWLVGVLATANWSIIFGQRGEKELLNSDNSRPGLAGDWTEINTTAVLYGSGTWKIGPTRKERRHLN